MNKSVLGGASAVILAAILGFYFGRAHSPQAPADSAPAEKKVLYWHDPMHPGQKFDKPGKSPFMDMQLEPVYAGEGADAGTVEISPRMQQSLGIRTAPVARSSMAPALSMVANVAYNEREVVLVQARSNGFIERLHVRAPFDTVRKGQVLAELLVPDWVAAQEEYFAAVRMKNAPELVAAALQRMRLAGMDEAQVGRVIAGGKVQARVAVLAPASGVVTELLAREGMGVAAGATLYRINGLGSVWINAEVPEAAASRVQRGAAVTVRTGDGEVAGRIAALLPEVAGDTRTLKARIELANPGARLAPGMFATVLLPGAAGADVLTVPTEAVIATGKRTVVMVMDAEGSYRPVDVETGGEANGQTQIRKGLAEGQKVVVSGQFLLDSEASLKGMENRK